VEAAIVRQALDNRWSDHLATIEDIREGIHLQRYGGREPLTEFHRQIVQAFEELMAGIRSDAVERFSALRVVNGAIDEASLGLAGSSATWTYLVNDNPFSTLGMSLLASRTLTSATGVIAVMYWPLTVIAAVSVLVRRWLRRERHRPF
jgi:preprotein translocase subunit SecA